MTPAKPNRRTEAATSATAPVFFANAAQFRAWLARHAGTAPMLNVGFFKAGSGRPSITWPQSVDEALCYGWIDGVRRRIDDDSYQIRFSPRRKGSVWSSINIARARALITEGRMRLRGRQAFEARIERNSNPYSQEQRRAPRLTRDELARFKRNANAWAMFEREPPSRRRALLYWIVSARQPATRARRLDKLIASAAAGVRLLP